MHKGNSNFGKNNFDRLEAAGLVAGDGDETASIKARVQQRITDLQALAAKLARVEGALAGAYVMNKADRLKKITQVMKAVAHLYASKDQMPTGSKKHVAKVLNELTSLREGVYSSNTAVDKKALILIAATQAKQDVLTMVTVAEARLDKIIAESTDGADMKDFYQKTGDIIQKYAKSATDLIIAIKAKPFVIARSPVVPANLNVNVEKLARSGFKVENLGGYAVFANQIVLGISPRNLLGDSAGAIKGERASALIREEAERLRKMMQKKMGTKLQFVSDRAFSYGSGTWFWLMTDQDLDLVAKAALKVQRWGFAFN